MRLYGYKLFWNRKAKPKTYCVHLSIRMTKKHIRNHTGETKEKGILLHLVKVKEYGARKTRLQKIVKKKKITKKLFINVTLSLIL